MTIKVNIEFLVDEKDSVSMNTLTRFFSAFENANLQTGGSANPFKEKNETSDKTDDTDWFISSQQVDNISDFINSNKTPIPTKIEGYKRKFKEKYATSKRVHMMNSKERSDMNMACRCIANEVLAGGLIMVGRSYMHDIKVSVCVKDHRGTYHDISFTRILDGKLMSLDQIDDMILKCMVELGVGSKYCKSYDIDHRNKSSVSLPTDVKPEPEPE